MKALTRHEISTDLKICSHCMSTFCAFLSRLSVCDIMSVFFRSATSQLSQPSEHF